MKSCAETRRGQFQSQEARKEAIEGLCRLHDMDGHLYGRRENKGR